jgi:hypothetical protein
MTSSKHTSAEDTRFLPLHALAPDAPASAETAGEGITVFIKRATEETMGTGDESLILPKNSGAIPPATMLAAVTYCYASDVYESERIEHKLFKDTKLRTSIGMELPAASAIRRFRRLNRGTILKVLEKAFRWQRKEANPFAPKPKSGDDTMIMARKQAEQKLELATLIDSN